MTGHLWVSRSKHTYPPSSCSQRDPVPTTNWITPTAPTMSITTPHTYVHKTLSPPPPHTHTHAMNNTHLFSCSLLSSPQLDVSSYQLIATCQGTGHRWHCILKTSHWSPNVCMPLHTYHHTQVTLQHTNPDMGEKHSTLLKATQTCTSIASQDIVETTKETDRSLLKDTQGSLNCRQV